MEEHEYGFKHLSHDKKFYIYPNSEENLLRAVKDGYKLEYDTNKINGRHRIWISYNGEINNHFTCYRMIPKVDCTE